MYRASFSDMDHEARKIHGALLPQEYELLRLTEEIENRVHTFPSWTEQTSACAWEGVECDESGQVSKLLWSSTRLGRDLYGIMKWTHTPRTVVSVDVSGYHDRNHLHGSIDVTLLPSCLEDFSVMYSRFTGFIDFTLLPSALIYFNISDNYFQGTVDTSRLPSGIRYIRIDSNLFSGILQTTSLPKSLISFDMRMTKIQLSTDEVPSCVLVDVAPIHQDSGPNDQDSDPIEGPTVLFSSIEDLFE